MQISLPNNDSFASLFLTHFDSSVKGIFFFLSKIFFLLHWLEPHSTILKRSRIGGPACLIPNFKRNAFCAFALVF